MTKYALLALVALAVAAPSLSFAMEHAAPAAEKKHEHHMKKHAKKHHEKKEKDKAEEQKPAAGELNQ